MKVVYVAGPFRSMNANGKSNAWGVQTNIMSAMAVALEVWKLGHVALCPHANTMFFQDADGCEDDVWLKGDLELLNRCDAIMMAPGWERSSGAKAELAHSVMRGLPAFYDLKSLATWLKS